MFHFKQRHFHKNSKFVDTCNTAVSPTKKDMGCEGGVKRTWIGVHRYLQKLGIRVFSKTFVDT